MRTIKHDVPDELLCGLLANDMKPEDLMGEHGLLQQLTKLLVERALDAELLLTIRGGSGVPAPDAMVPAAPCA